MVALPSDEVLRAVLPWWVNSVMQEAHETGVQHRAAKVLKEVWRFQDVVPWVVDEVPAIVDDQPSEWLSESPAPSMDELGRFQTWVSMVVTSYSNFYTWNSLDDIVPRHADSPEWTSLTTSRKW